MWILYFTPFTNISSRWIVDLNVIGKTIEFMEESLREYIYDLG